jgi:hypothetical protein
MIKKTKVTKKVVAKKPIRKMAKGGTSNPCPEGYYYNINYGDCFQLGSGPGLLSGNSAKLGLGILGAAGAGMLAIGSKKRIDKRLAKEEADKVVDTTMNKINAPMKKGGTVGKTAAKRKVAAKRKTVVRKKK